MCQPSHQHVTGEPATGSAAGCLAGILPAYRAGRRLAPSFPVERSSKASLWLKIAERCSAGQPRAAVPTWPVVVRWRSRLH
jgi:hypothetical protein